MPGTQVTLKSGWGELMTTQHRSDTYVSLRVLHHRAPELSSSTPQATVLL